VPISPCPLLSRLHWQDLRREGATDQFVGDRVRAGREQLFIRLLEELLGALCHLRQIRHVKISCVCQTQLILTWRNRHFPMRSSRQSSLAMTITRAAWGGLTTLIIAAVMTEAYVPPALLYSHENQRVRVLSNGVHPKLRYKSIAQAGRKACVVGMEARAHAATGEIFSIESLKDRTLVQLPVHWFHCSAAVTCPLLNNTATRNRDMACLSCQRILSFVRAGSCGT